MIEGMAKEDPPTIKKLPVEADVPELLADAGRQKEATPLQSAVGDMALIAFYYLLRVGEYTVKGHRNSSKQTEQFRLRDVTFFYKDKYGKLRQMRRDASDEEIMAAHSATMKLGNQKNGWKNVCIHHEATGDDYFCPIRALGRRFIHVRANFHSADTYLSAYWVDGIRCDITDEDMRRALKLAAGQLEYPAERGIPIERVDTHSLRSGGANALALAGYSDTQIQKMGRWRGATFKEYVREDLACYSAGMTRSMKRTFGFVNIAGGAFNDVTTTVVATPYNVCTPTKDAAATGVAV